MSKKINRPIYAHQRPRPTLGCGRGRTKSEFARECDINYLYKRFRKTGEFPQPQGKLVYADMTALPSSYHEALNLINSVSVKFSSLPSEVRQKYHNDPAEYLAALEAEQAEARKADLARQAEIKADKEFQVSQVRKARKESSEPLKTAPKAPKSDKVED